MWNDSFAFLNCGKVAHEASLVTCHMPMMMIVEPKNVIQVMGSPKKITPPKAEQIVAMVLKVDILVTLIIPQA